MQYAHEHDIVLAQRNPDEPLPVPVLFPYGVRWELGHAEYEADLSEVVGPASECILCLHHGGAGTILNYDSTGPKLHADRKYKPLQICYW